MTTNITLRGEGGRICTTRADYDRINEHGTAEILNPVEEAEAGAVWQTGNRKSKLGIGEQVAVQTVHLL